MKNICLVGMGISNIAMKSYFKNKKANVFTYDDKYKADYNYQKILKDKPLFDISFLSPGIYPNSVLFSLFNKCSLSVTNELFYSLTLIKNKIHIIGVTGSNGKTTTVLILKTILERLGAKVLVAGNIGEPLIEKIKDINKYDYLIVEISSFQAGFFNKLVLSSLIITSYSPNHLDAYFTEEEYLLSKKRLIKCANKVYADINTKKQMNLEDVNIVDTSNYLGEKKDYLLVKALLNDLGYTEETFININYKNIIPPSRYEEFLKINNTIFIDDSKATSLGAVVEDLNKSNIYTVLILGGHLKSKINKKINTNEILIYGKENNLFLSYVENAVLYNDLNELIDSLIIDKSRTTRILFAPGGSSLYYENFLVRGKEFKKKIIEKFGS